jgi:hypothetical protein
MSWWLKEMYDFFLTLAGMVFPKHGRTISRLRGTERGEKTLPATARTLTGWGSMEPDLELDLELDRDAEPSKENDLLAFCAAMASPSESVLKFLSSASASVTFRISGKNTVSRRTKELGELSPEETFLGKGVTGLFLFIDSSFTAVNEVFLFGSIGGKDIKISLLTIFIP